MKNIHLIKANRPPISGDLLLRHLWKGEKDECKSFWVYESTVTIDGTEQYITKGGSFRDWVGSFEVQNVYITNDELPKKGDWCYLSKDNKEYVYKCTETPQKGINWGKKIILAKNPELIADGIQPIDYEFLQWFCKNSECEEVKIELLKDSEDHPEIVGNPKEEWEYYKIILPQSEQKQETIEEAAENWNKEQTTKEFGKPHNAPNRVKSFIEGAKYQAKRMFSEEQVEEAIRLARAKHHNYTDVYTKEQIIEKLNK